MNNTDSFWSVGFAERITVAAALAVVGAGFSWIAGPFGTGVFLLPMLLATLYAGWVLYRSPARSGKLVAALSWLAATAAMLVVGVPFVLVVLAMAAMTWLLRALFCYNRLLPAAIDSLVVGAALIAGAWASAQTGSVLIAGWALFLVLSVFVRWPVSSLARAEQPAQTNEQGNGLNASKERFAAARASADIAVQKILNTA